MSLRYLKIIVVMLSFSAALSAQTKEIVILHTNDTHSQIEPNPTTAFSNPGEGGVARRFAAIQKIRKENKNVLLFDAGDFVQGTPYYNVFKGDAEITLMNKMGYHAATFGNHEFDNGIEPLLEMLKKMEFPLVSTNYDVSNTPLADYVKRTHTIDINGVKIGLIGLTIDPDGLIAKNNYKGVVYLDPVESTNIYAKQLKDNGCDLVIVWSHLGYWDNDTRGDRMVAVNSTDVDMIIGGHTHTALG